MVYNGAVNVLKQDLLHMIFAALIFLDMTVSECLLWTCTTVVQCSCLPCLQSSSRKMPGWVFSLSAWDTRWNHQCQQSTVPGAAPVKALTGWRDGKRNPPAVQPVSHSANIKCTLKMFGSDIFPFFPSVVWWIQRHIQNELWGQLARPSTAFILISVLSGQNLALTITHLHLPCCSSYFTGYCHDHILPHWHTKQTVHHSFVVWPWSCYCFFLAWKPAWLPPPTHSLWQKVSLE